MEGVTALRLYSSQRCGPGFCYFSWGSYNDLNHKAKTFFITSSECAAEHALYISLFSALSFYFQQNFSISLLDFRCRISSSLRAAFIQPRRHRKQLATASATWRLPSLCGSTATGLLGTTPLQSSRPSSSSCSSTVAFSSAGCVCTPLALPTPSLRTLFITHALCSSFFVSTSS